MATYSSEFVDDAEFERQPSLHRSRSGGYADHLEEQVKWDRRDREREMKRYHDSRYGPLVPQQRSTSDRLCVPVFEDSTRRNRSNSDVSRRQEGSSSRYNVQEVRPGPKPSYDYDLTSEPVLPSQLPVRFERKLQHQKKPSITVQIHQENPPPSSKPAGHTPKRSPNASPRSPTAQPQLHYQFATLQNQLAQITAHCAPYLKVEPADPRDLTFTKISDQAKSFSFELQVWAQVVNLNSMSKIDSQKRKIVESASKNLDRLLDRVTELNQVCADAKPRDLKFVRLPSMEDEVVYDDVDSDHDISEVDPTESPAYIIHSCLHSIEMQISNLKRLTRPLQEATLEAKDEVMGVDSLVAEVTKYFGSNEALDRFAIDTRFAGGKALDEARYAAAH